ncbi:MAG: succinate dehydrogenase, cytochrome b556 subunit [Anaerolineae bacterium]|nr:succinate dehydrogenase, cytochrome b556 subunit [Anaerolineae bacterium]
MTSLVLTLTETLRYKGAIGQWSWVLHRISGLGVVLFLTLHVIDTSWSVFYPDLYVKAIAVYQTPLFTIGEFGLVACVVYHAFNGIRIAVMDFKPVWWRHQQKAAWWVLGATVVTLIPVFLLMFGHVLKFYQDPERQILPFSFVIESQLPFAVGIAAALVAGVLFSGVVGLIAPAKPKDKKAKAQGSRLERFWWSYMRLSGVLILPLVFGHLAMMHVVQGVFDITAQNFTVVGTQALNDTGTAVEFVAERWNLLIGPLAVWRLYDFALLALVTVHGFNGLRLVLTDYTAFSPLLRRGMMYVCVIGAVVLLVLGTGALIGTIDETAIKLATEAMENLHK